MLAFASLSEISLLKPFRLYAFTAGLLNWLRISYIMWHEFDHLVTNGQAHKTEHVIDDRLKAWWTYLIAKASVTLLL